MTYNTASREVIWNVGRVPRGTGITGAGRSVSFQIGFTPLLSQVGTVPPIVNDAVLTGHDDFANVDLRVTKTSLRTQLTSDSLFPKNGGVIVE